MTIIQKFHAKSVIAKVARRQGISTRRCRAEMAAAIESAWETADPIVRQRQIQLVGEGRVPTPEEFIFLISKKIT